MEEKKQISDPRPPEELAEVRKPTSLLIAQFFLFPLIIIAICVGIFLLFGYLTYEQRTPREYLDEIRTGSENRRWQAAYELSNVVSSRKKKDLQNPDFVARVEAIYTDSPPSEYRSRQFLSLILGELGDPSAVPTLIAGLRREEVLKSADWKKEWFQVFNPSLEEIHDGLAQNQINTLWALGKIRDNAAVPGVVEQLENEDPAVRKMAAYVLGALGDPSVAENLKKALTGDTNEDVRWNAAIALASVNDASGAELLIKLLDSDYLDTFRDMAADQKSTLVVAAIKSLGRIKYEPAHDRIEALSRDNTSLAVRDAALEALEKF